MQFWTPGHVVSHADSFFVYHVTVTAIHFCTNMKPPLLSKLPWASPDYTHGALTATSQYFSHRHSYIEILSADMLIFLTRVESTQIKKLYSIFTLVFAMIPQDLGSC